MRLSEWIEVELLRYDWQLHKLYKLDEYTEGHDEPKSKSEQYLKRMKYVDEVRDRIMDVILNERYDEE